MHRVSCVWKEQNPKSLPYHSQISKHNKHETHWEKSHRVWLGVAMFLFLFTVCLFAIPTTLDMSIEGQGLVPVLERKKGLQQLWRTSVPSKQLEVQEEGIRSVQGRIGGWTLKSNHFTLFNLSSKVTPQQSCEFSPYCWRCVKYLVCKLLYTQMCAFGVHYQYSFTVGSQGSDEIFSLSSLEKVMVWYFVTDNHNINCSMGVLIGFCKCSRFNSESSEVIQGHIDLRLWFTLKVQWRLARKWAMRQPFVRFGSGHSQSTIEQPYQNTQPIWSRFFLSSCVCFL